MTQTQAPAGDSKQPMTPDGRPKLSLSDLYVQAYTNMRATDEISLKLLAAIPFVSGVGISLLVRKSTEAFPAEARFGVSLFAAVVTFAIYRWECRNISNCRHYRDYAAYLLRNYSDELSENGKVSLQKNDVPDLAMSAQREELLRLVEELPDEEVSAVLDDVRRHLRAVSKRPWPLAWFLSRRWVKWFLNRRWVKPFFSWKWGKTQAERLLYWTVIVGWLTTGAYVIYP
jgi:hypothetical protein